MITDSITITLNDGQSTKSFKVDTSATQRVRFSDNIAQNVTNELINIAAKTADMKEVFLCSDQDLTLKTNSSSAPDDTITLKAGVPVIWYANCGHANPLAHDLTAMYVTTGAVGSAGANLDISIMTDATPSTP